MNNNKSTVLIIDDDADIREVIKIFLETDGYHVNTAADGYDALEQLHNGSRPKLIILDLMMPRLDGEQFMKAFHESGLGDIPIVILSGHSAAEKKAIELNADYCLLKPVEVRDLLDTVHRFTNVQTRNDAA